MKHLLSIIALVFILVCCDREGKYFDSPLGHADKGSVLFTLDVAQITPSVSNIHIFAFDSLDLLVVDEYYPSAESLASEMLLVSPGEHTFAVLLNMGADFTLPTSKSDSSLQSSKATSILTLNDLTKWLYSRLSIYPQLCSGIGRVDVVKAEMNRIELDMFDGEDGLPVVSDLVFLDGVDLAPVVSSSKEARIITFSSRKAWSVSVAEEDKEWCSVLPLSGSAGEAIEITITAEANDTYKERKSTITLASDKITKDIVLTQSQFDIISVSDDVRISSTGGEFTITVSANIGFDAPVIEYLDGGATSWLSQVVLPRTRGVVDTILTFKAGVNFLDQREAIIIIKSTNDTDTITVTQTELLADVIFSNPLDTILTASSSAYSRTLTFSSTRAWSVSVPEEDKEWCSVLPLSGSAGESIEITLTADANGTYDERQSTIVLESENITKDIVLTQSQFDIISVSDDVRISSADSTFTITVSANIGFGAPVIEYADGGQTGWLSQVVTPRTRGVVDTKLTFKAVANPLESERTATITITPTGGLGKEIIVTQAMLAGQIVVSGETTHTISSTSTTAINVTFSSTRAWTVTKSHMPSGWTLESSSGTANITATFAITPTQNTTDADITATFTISSDGGATPQTITVKQDKKSKVTLDQAIIDHLKSSTLIVATIGGSKEITFTSTKAWTATVSSVSDWCRLTNASGDGVDNQSFTISGTSQPSSSSRTATVDIKIDGAVMETITVKQNACLKLSATEDSASEHSFIVSDRNLGGVGNAPVPLTGEAHNFTKVSPDVNTSFKGGYYNWGDANKACSDLPCDGDSDKWRLPTEKELYVIVGMLQNNADDNQGDNYIFWLKRDDDHTYFPLAGGELGFYWSSTTRDGSAYVLILNSFGRRAVLDIPRLDSFSVRCVKTVTE